MIRAVLDVNVLVSSLIRLQGTPGQLVRRLAEEAFEVVLSPGISTELRRALTYPEVRRRIALSEDELDLWLVALEVLAVHVEPTVEVKAVLADHDDDIYVETALEARADYIVTGDHHLLELGEYEDVRIVRPNVFVELLV